ncbi:amino acid ABC transporter substrate-binding protein [Nonomuraea sp. K274]|uniref:Amino acid ABC transporter substrate-binding protein n=1 Tax=Nonomuraea cypriaca TaxID=1187855 RepID=A0A931F6B6_9ACTN|nr:ABC transporter substrate-binding protein [Nonomuraea cypriaca]MBF8193058.1 amino acid ABC transporter substrate-binding protein [Nonomuraea cypriaca]
MSHRDGACWKGFLVSDLRSVIERLIRRPPFWRPDPPLPVVCVSGEYASAAVEAMLGSFQDGVPFARADDGAHPTMLELVKSLAGQLGKPVGGSLLPPPRFPLAQFVIWAREQRPPAGSGADWPPRLRTQAGHREFRQRFRSWQRSKYGGEHSTRTSADFLARAAATWVPVGTLAVWLSGMETDLIPMDNLVSLIPWAVGLVVALVGTTLQGLLSITGALFFGWFRRQPYVRRRGFGRLSHYALRLAEEDDDQIEPLLVHALLRDLREAYKKRVLPWPNWGRECYGLVVLDVADPDGVNSRFLRILEETTDTTGLLAPVVVVAMAPDGVPAARRDPVGLGRFPDAVLRWLAEAALRVPKLRLYVHVTEPPEATAFPPRRPRRGRALGYWSAVMTVLVILPLTGAAWVDHQWRNTCGGRSWARWTGQECVGVVNANARSPEKLFNAQVSEWLRRIDDNNERAGKSGHYVDVVLFGEYSPWNVAANDPRVVSALSELAAVEYYQRNIRSSPRLRVLVANGGDNFGRAGEVARLVVEMAERNRRLMGVVGLARSLTGVSDAIRELHQAKIPMVSGTATADMMGTIPRPGTPGTPSRYYFHVSPTNFREAWLGARFAKTLLPRKRRIKAVIVKDRTSKDQYTSNLADDFKAAVLREGFKLRAELPYSEDGGLPPAASEACRQTPDVIFYAGRASDFLDFLTAVEGRRCGAVTVIAGDDVVKVMPHHGYEIAGMQQVEVYYLALAQRSLWKSPVPAKPTKFARYLLSGNLMDMSDDHLILAYDAISVVYQAVSGVYDTSEVAAELREDELPTRGQIQHELEDTTGDNA